MQHELTSPKYRSAEVQEISLAKVKAAYQAARDDGFEVLQWDQCLFSPQRYEKAQWAPRGRPLLTQNRWAKSPVVVVNGFISERSGKVRFDVADQTAFDGSDIADFVLKLRQQMGPGKKIALYGDNAPINKSQTVRAAAQRCRPDLAECRLIWCHPYRPDLSK